MSYRAYHDKFGQMVECSFKNLVVLGSNPVAVVTILLKLSVNIMRMFVT